MNDFKERAENFIINYEIIDVDTATLATLLHQVWEEGRVAGLEKAAKRCEDFGKSNGKLRKPNRVLSEAIRSLKEKK